MFFSPDMAEQDRALAERINNEVLADPKSRYAGKFIGIANGQIVAIADDQDQLDDLLDRLELDPAKQFFFQAGADYDKVEYIWEMRRCRAPLGHCSKGVRAFRSYSRHPS
jgi:hypothetical protein